jgi:hypothetical protein
MTNEQSNKQLVNKYPYAYDYSAKIHILVLSVLTSKDFSIMARLTF